jgi:hypothetical protein
MFVRVSTAILQSVLAEVQEVKSKLGEVESSPSYGPGITISSPSQSYVAASRQLFKT